MSSAAHLLYRLHLGTGGCGDEISGTPRKLRYSLVFAALMRAAGWHVCCNGNAHIRDDFLSLSSSSSTTHGTSSTIYCISMELQIAAHLDSAVVVVRGQSLEVVQIGDEHICIHDKDDSCHVLCSSEHICLLDILTIFSRAFARATRTSRSQVGNATLPSTRNFRNSVVTASTSYDINACHGEPPLGLHPAPTWPPSSDSQLSLWVCQI
jgi:hypothetical protein